MKILTLNLWRYYDWEKRFENILKSISKKDPDIIFLQEVQLNKEFSNLSQVEILKNKLSGYKYSIFSTTTIKTRQRDVALKIPVQQGIAILSKYPITNSFNYFLKLSKDEDERRSILCFDIEKDGNIKKMANVHLGNRTDWAEKQLKEIIDFLSQRNEKRVLVGDFNLFEITEYKKTLKDYINSYSFKKYDSFISDDKTGTLDYVLIPNSYNFKSLDTIDEYLSDHKGLYVEIE